MKHKTHKTMTTTNKHTLIHDGQSLVSARYVHSGVTWEEEIRTYDDGFGTLYVHRDSMGISGIVRAQTWEDAYSICEDEFFSEADETVDELVKEYGFKRDHVKVIHPAVVQPDGSFAVDTTVKRDATNADYELTGGRLLDGQFVTWETRVTPEPDAWTENELFQEAYGFRPNGPNNRDTLNHGIYAKDLNGDALDVLTPELAESLGVEIQVEDNDDE